jgi:4-hydroxy-tetrahydrodipicolinate synthase
MNRKESNKEAEVRLLGSGLRGIIPPLVTPLSDNDTLDAEGLERLIERLIAGGVHGLFILGTTGEAQSISYNLRRRMIEETSRINRQRLPLLVCISDTSITESINLAHIAAGCGADAVVSAPPYYYVPSQVELAEFYHDLADRLPLPLFLYNMPSHTKVNFAPETIRRIAENKQVIGFKDSSANAVYFQSVMTAMQDRPDFSMLVGPEEITAEIVLMGGHGGINGGANMFPELYVNLYHAAATGNLEEVRRLQKIVMLISTTIYTVGKYGSSYLKGVKCALGLLGVCNDHLAAPFHKFDEPEKERIRQALKRIEEEM